jgi:nicotinamidase-related amidase
MDGERFRRLVDPTHAAVVTVEMQRGVVGDLPVLPDLAAVAQAEGLAARVGGLCKAAREAGARVVHCTAEFRPDGAGAALNCRLMAVNARARRERGAGPTDIGTPGVELVPELGADESDVVVPRLGGVTPFTGTALDQVLRTASVRTVIPAGVSLNLALVGLVLTAVDLGYEVVLPEDAVVGVPADYGKTVIRNSLAYVTTVVTTDALVEAWAGAGA